MCGRCALKVDWQGVVLTAQSLAVRDAVMTEKKPAPAKPIIPAASEVPAGSNLPPADPFAS